MLPHSVFRNYDIRGEFGVDLTVEVVAAIAAGYAAYAHPTQVVVGTDCRLSSPVLKEALIKGLLESGVSVVDIGPVSTDVCYFASWFYGYDGGVMVTASHMPKQFNGLKFLRQTNEGMLVPIGRGLGMEELETVSNENHPSASAAGTLEVKDVWLDFVKFSRGFISASTLSPLKVVMDAGSGMGGPTARRVFEGLGFDIVPLYFEPDGHFPYHPANPIEEANRRDLVAKVKETKVDLGVAWDADCDRVYFVDEAGEFINGDFITALLAAHFLKTNPGASIVYDIRAGSVVPDTIKKFGGVGHCERVGHTYIKQRMLQEKAVFGGEISGHYYFAQSRYMENGFVPPLIIMEMMKASGKKLSQLIAELGEYYISGEINFTVTSVEKVFAILEKKYADANSIDRTDGLTFIFSDWRFNIRPSANDPVVRLNLEAKSKALLDEKVSEISELIKTS